MIKNLEKNQLVLCTVDKIVGTTVFVRLDECNNLSGTITFPEVAPGRIRNIREYAFPGKKIVCKILQAHPNHAELSLRRVKANERVDFIDSKKKERSYSAMLKTIVGDKAPQIIENIKETEIVAEFFDKARENKAVLEKYFSKEEAEKIFKILGEKKAKETIISKQFSLSTKAPNGIVLVKDIIKQSTSSCTGCEVAYIAAGRYSIKLKAKDPKSAENQLKKAIESIESLANKNSCNFDYKE
jgi:translation initiation factor 2 alpha subunit (eIF-2alpha)